MKFLELCLVLSLFLGVSGCGGETVASKTAPTPANESATPSSPASSAPAPSATDEEAATEESEAPSEDTEEESAGSSTSSPQSDDYANEMSPEEAYEASMNSSSEEESYGEDESDANMAYEEEMAQQMADNYGVSSEDGESGISEDSYGMEDDGTSSPFGSSEAPEEMPEPLAQDYLSRAKRAFKGGMEAEAHNLLMAHLISEYDNASGTYSMARWSALLKKPVWALKIGIGVNNGAVKHMGAYHPVRAGMKAPIDKDGGSMSPDSGEPNQIVENYVGLAAEVAKRMFDEKFVAGDLGEVFSQDGTGAGEIEPASRRGNGSGQFVAASNEFEGYSDEDDGSDGSDDASNMSAPIASDMQLGDFGGGGGQGIGGLPLFQSGLGFLGTGRAAELLEKAKAAGLDAFLQFDVSVKQNPKNNAVYNDCSLRLMSVATGKPIGRSSSKIKNVEIYQAMQSRDIDPTGRVTEALSGVFNSAMAQLSLAPLPELTPQQVRTRVGSFIVSPPQNPLDALAEIRLYQSKGLIPEDEVHLAFDLLMGDEGLVLAAGPAELQQELLNEKLPTVGPAL